MMCVLAAVSFQGPKEKSRWLLWKPWIIMVAEARAGHRSRRKKTQEQQEHQWAQVPPPLPPAQPRYHARPHPPPAGRARRPLPLLLRLPLQPAPPGSSGIWRHLGATRRDVMRARRKRRLGLESRGGCGRERPAPFAGAHWIASSRETSSETGLARAAGRTWV